MRRKTASILLLSICLLVTSCSFSHEAGVSHSAEGELKDIDDIIEIKALRLLEENELLRNNTLERHTISMHYIDDQYMLTALEKQSSKSELEWYLIDWLTQTVDRLNIESNTIPKIQGRVLSVFDDAEDKGVPIQWFPKWTRCNLVTGESWVDPYWDTPLNWRKYVLGHAYIPTLTLENIEVDDNLLLNFVTTDKTSPAASFPIPRVEIEGIGHCGLLIDIYNVTMGSSAYEIVSIVSQHECIDSVDLTTYQDAAKMDHISLLIEFNTDIEYTCSYPFEGYMIQFCLQLRRASGE